MSEFADIVGKSHRIVFFGGAGVSTASGIPDFRSDDGIYAEKFHGRSPEEILSSTFFVLNTREFYNFYRTHMVYPDARPNVVHKVLYELEKEDRLRGIVTQNIDGLHKKAGNKRVYELHGSIYENYCVDCESSYPLDKIMNSDGIPRCDKCGGIVKPGIVLYGEAPDKYTGIGACREISNADTLIVAGTSLSVEPAASNLKYFQGRHLIVINREPTSVDEQAELVIRDDIVEVFEKLL